MTKTTFTFIVMLCLRLSFQSNAQSDARGTADNIYVPRIANYYIEFDSGKTFDEFNFWNGSNYTTIIGKSHLIHYNIKRDAKALKEDAIIAHYIDEIKKKKGEQIFKGNLPDELNKEKGGLLAVTLKTQLSKEELWVQVVAFNKGADYELFIVQGKEKKEIISAKKLLESIQSDGRVAIYINFKINEATIEQVSQNVINQVIDMMKNEPGLNLQIEGHSDNTGNAAFNKSLSEKRAVSVMNALVNAGIDPNRLSFIGYGSDKPIESNETEEGRAKNRRVELVKK